MVRHLWDQCQCSEAAAAATEVDSNFGEVLVIWGGKIDETQYQRACFILRGLCGTGGTNGCLIR